MNNYELQKYINAGINFYNQQKAVLMKKTIEAAINSYAQDCREQLESIITVKDEEIVKLRTELQREKEVNKLLIENNNTLKEEKNFYKINLDKSENSLKTKVSFEKAVLEFIGQLLLYQYNKEDHNKEIETDALLLRVKLFLTQTLPNCGIEAICTEYKDDKSLDDKMHECGGEKETSDISCDGKIWRTITPGVMYGDTIIKEKVAIWKYVRNANEDMMKSVENEDINENFIDNSTFEQHSTQYTKNDCDLDDYCVSIDYSIDDKIVENEKSSVTIDDVKKDSEDRVVVKLSTDVDKEKISYDMNEKDTWEITVADARELFYEILYGENIKENDKLNINNKYETVILQCKRENNNRVLITIKGKRETLLSKKIDLE